MLHNMRGVILAGGTGTRLWPLTKTINKHLLPIFDKPMIYYPLSTLMLAGIREIVIISNPQHIELFRTLLGDGSDYGLEITYLVQNKPGGLPQGILIASDFIGNENFALILGDNVFYGVGLGSALNLRKEFSGAKIFCYQVSNPNNFGVLEVEGKKVLSIEEKPDKPKSNLAITGLYFFDNKARFLAKEIKPSLRGELEIVDLLKIYALEAQLDFEIFPRGTAWLDTGSPESLLEASEFIQIVEKRQGNKVACLEEIAWRNGWISEQQLIKLSKSIFSQDYKKYLLNLLV
jgi:glucose-1-phosphate thymidylyltransferase